MIIGLDLDNTLTRAPVDAADVAAANLGITDYPRVITDYWYSFLSEIHRQEVQRLFLTPEFMGAVKPLPGVQAKLLAWSLKHELIIITAREEPIRDCTRDLIQKYFPMVGEVYFVKIRESKAELMQQLGIEIWIDDAPHGIECSLELGIPTFLVSDAFTVYNHTSRKLLPSCRVVSSVANLVLDQPCPWCGKAPRVLSRRSILDTDEYHVRFGCSNKSCAVQPFTEGLQEETCIARWNSMEI